MRYIRFTENNIKKILSGQKTATSRTYPLPKGPYNIAGEKDLRIFVTSSLYFQNIRAMSDEYLERWIRAEGFENWADMLNNATFQHTKDFLLNKRDLYVAWFYLL